MLFWRYKMIEDIKVLKFGSLTIESKEQIKDNYLKMGNILGRMGDSSVILIKFNKKYYLIDTGFANEGDLSQKNIEFNKKYLKNILDIYDLKFDDISGIFITHWHLDHFGNLHLFNNVDIYTYHPKFQINDEDSIDEIYSNINYIPDIKYIARLHKFEHLLPIKYLSDKDTFAGCKIFPTPGHTLSHCSLILNYFGINIIIAGDAIVSLSYYENGDVWTYNAGNLGVKICLKSMQKIIKVADYIIPGHDQPFQNYKKFIK